jgi:hypothetical protein
MVLTLASLREIFSEAGESNGSVTLFPIMGRDLGKVSLAMFMNTQ